MVRVAPEESTMTETTSTPIDTLYQRFSDALTKVGGACTRVATPAEAARTIVAIAGGTSSPIWTAPQLQEAMLPLIDALASTGIDAHAPKSAAEVRDQPFGLTVARQAIAETGSVVLVERELSDRIVSLMTETCIVACALDDLAPSLDDAGETLAAAGREHGSYATLVTGPSRTADIERQLTVGVQGPARLHVIFIERPD
jgi:L-lactate dehydrogenase complex protein LldG